MNRTSIACFVTCLLGLLPSGAVRAEQPIRDHDIVADDYFSIGVITTLSVAPDGRHVAYVEQRWEPPDDKRNSDLWVVSTETKETQRLTFDKAGEGLPQWSPDGRFVYFTANYKRAGEDNPPYDGKTQVWRIAPGGDLLAITRVKDGVGLFELSRDGKTLYYTVGSEETEDDWKEMKTKHKDLQYGHGVTKFSRVYKLDLQNWRTEKLIDDKRVIRSMRVAPDQSRIAMITTPAEELIHNEGWSRIDLYDAKAKEVSIVTEDGWRKDHPSPFGWVDDASWSADGKALGFTVSFDGYPPRIYVAEWGTGESPTRTELKRPDGVTVSSGTLRWRGESRTLCFSGEDHARSRVYAIADVREGRQGSVTTLTPGDVTVAGYGFSRSGDAMAIITSTHTDPPDVYLVKSAGRLDRLTNVNPQVDTWKLPQISLVQWKAPDGAEVEGILELPSDHKKGDPPLPMVVELHGGPTSATLYQMQFWIYGRTLLPAKGYALLSPNYRGSTGYGDKFLTDLVGRENDIEVKDILAGVDAMVERGIADPQRLGVSGWSNGGFLTNCLITQTDRFKAASSGAGVIDQVIQWGTEDTPGHVINFMKGNFPWSNPAQFLAGSPLAKLDKVRTPTLIHVGEKDERVPAANARTLYRALRFYLKVPTELAVYPGEGHGLTTYKHRKAKMDWDLAWFDRYIMGKTSETPKESKPETPAS